MDHDGEGWYRDPELLEEIALQQQLTTDILGRDRHSLAQVAVILSEESQPYLRYDADLTDALLGRQMSELTSLGAPFDTFRAADLERLFAGPQGDQYRLVIFLDTIYLSPAERAAIRTHVATKNRTLLWVYAAGLATETALSTEAMAATTGIRTAIREMGGPLRVESYLTGTRLSYGTDRELAPVLIGDDPDAHVLGWELHRGAPGLLSKEMGTWRSVWSAAPALPAIVLREFARQAGIHLYTEAGDYLIPLPSLLGLHAALDGTRTIMLPDAYTVTNALTGELVAQQTTSFEAELKRGKTYVWRLE
ncbi:MAG: hypothetical protein ACYDBB_26970 [Armatimonadota bacterium]